MTNRVAILLVVLVTSSENTGIEHIFQRFGPDLCEIICHGEDAGSALDSHPVLMTCRVVVNTSTTGIPSGELDLRLCNNSHVESEQLRKKSTQSRSSGYAPNFHSTHQKNTELQKEFTRLMSRLSCLDGWFERECKTLEQKIQVSIKRNSKKRAKVHERRKSGKAEATGRISVHERRKSGKAEATGRISVNRISNSKVHAKPCPLIWVKDFHHSCRMCKTRDIKRYVSIGKVDVNCRDSKGRTAVMHAAMSRCVSVLDYLVLHDCNLKVVDNLNDSVLHYGCRGCNKDIITKLLENHKSDLEYRGQEGRTPLMEAVYKGCVAAVQLLMEKGADMKTVDDYKDTILHEASKQGEYHMVKYILSLNIIDLESRGRNGWTPLMHAAASSSLLKVVVFLVKQNASVISLDDEGRNILHMACLHGIKRLVRYLITLDDLKGFQRKKDQHGVTPLQFAKNRGYDDIVELLK